MHLTFNCIVGKDALYLKQYLECQVSRVLHTDTELDIGGS